jgi:hypothetical protein
MCEELAVKRANGARELLGFVAGSGDGEARGQERHGRHSIGFLRNKVIEVDVCGGRDAELDAEPAATCKALNCIPCHLFD